ncbi:MAG: UTP--glucose-1-phosphate uridylyltransferase GalU [Acidobacteriota bacterium]|nr:UTP--glucose-1-phosphate uridylyltransferase GalU [Acidobacteriota bacterium]
MTLKVRKAVFPAAGMGTRFLPATKVMPKEMLPVVDKPIIQYGVEEAISSGCDEIIIITGRGKVLIEDHFDISFELEQTLAQRNKHNLLQTAQKVARMAHILTARQKEPLGLGHAVLMAKRLVGNEPFGVILPDDLVDSPGNPCLHQLIRVFEEKKASVIATQVVEGKAISAYGVLDAKPVDGFNGRLYEISNMVEKPAFADAPSNLAIIGRYVLTPRIFEMIEALKPGAGGELQLTDALRNLLQYEKIYGYVIEGKRHDAGDKLGFLKATVEYALQRPDLGPEFKEYLLSLNVEKASHGPV